MNYIKWVVFKADVNSLQLYLFFVVCSHNTASYQEQHELRVDMC